MDYYQMRAQIAKALANPVRLRILDILKERKLSVNEIAQAINFDQSTISKHLSILKQAGLLNVEIKGNKRYYFITCDCMENLFSCFEKVMERNLENLKNEIDNLSH